MALLDSIQSQASTEYAEFLADHSESTNVGDFILLYGQQVLEERNATYEIQTFLTSWFAIGDDSGGTALLMRLNGSTAVYRCGHGAIGSLEPELVSESFSTWYAAGCPASWIEFDDDDDC